MSLSITIGNSQNVTPNGSTFLQNKSNTYKVDNYNDNTPAYFYIINNCIISNHIKNNVIWEKYMHELFEKFINKDSIVLECGCHIGSHTIKLASLCKQIYGFEPMIESYEILEKNIKLNNIENTIIYNKGVSNKIGTEKFLWIANGNPGHSGLDNNPMGRPNHHEQCNESIEVKTVTIDSLNLEKLDFIKMDIEGYEPLAIEGAMNTIKKCKPIITLEIYKDWSGVVDINYSKELFKNLLDIGYNIHHIHEADFLFTPYYTAEDFK